jgi:Domain of unknown function (DUF4136)
MSSAKLCLAASGLALALAACTTLHVTTDVNPNFSVANCHSYTFAREHVANADQPAAFGNPLNADRLRAAIEANMAARGVTRVSDNGTADCFVGYAIGTRQVFNDYYGGLGYGGFGYGGFGYGGFGYGGFGGFGYGGYDGPWVENETRIAVDVFDTRSHKPIWHGAVSQTVSDLRGPNAEAKIGAATAAIFGKLPIGSAPVAAAPPPPHPAAASAAPVGPAAQAGFFMYPKNGQSADQQANDQRECQQWATEQAHGVTTGNDFRRAMIACITGRGYSVN